MHSRLAALPSQVRRAANANCLKLARVLRVLNNRHSPPVAHQRREGGFTNYLARPPPKIRDPRRRGDSKGRVTTTSELQRNRHDGEGLSREAIAKRCLSVNEWLQQWR